MKVDITVSITNTHLLKKKISNKLKQSHYVESIKNYYGVASMAKLSFLLKRL